MEVQDPGSSVSHGNVGIAMAVAAAPLGAATAAVAEMLLNLLHGRLQKLRGNG